MRRRLLLVEAAGQPIHLFRDGLDYAFILPGQDAERVIRPHRPNPSIHSAMLASADL